MLHFFPKKFKYLELQFFSIYKYILLQQQVFKMVPLPELYGLLSKYCTNNLLQPKHIIVQSKLPYVLCNQTLVLPKTMNVKAGAAHNSEQNVMTKSTA